MRILLASDTYPPDINGAAVFTQRLAEGLLGRGHEVCSISPSPRNYSFIEDVNGVRLYRAPSARYPFHPSFHIASPFKARAYIAQVLKEFTPDVVHSQAHFVIGRAALDLANLSAIATVATNHFMPENLIPQLPLSIPAGARRVISSAAWGDVGRVYRSARVVTAPTAYAVQVLKERAGISDAISVSCGVDLSLYSHDPAPRLSTSVIVLLFVGRLEVDKHVDELILAAANMRRDVAVRIVGDGGQRKRLQDLARARGLEGRVTWLGNISDEQLRKEYSRADVFCMPGTAELQSIATLEAMAAGLPVVVANAGALPLLVAEGVNGALYVPGDIPSFARALEFVIHEGARHAEFSKASRREAEKHDMSHTLDAFERIYESVS